MNRPALVVGFDVDNTLLDIGANDYRHTVNAFLASVGGDGSSDERFRAYETVRATGHALERLGLHNPIHHRGCVHGLAVLCLVHPWMLPANARSDLAISSDQALGDDAFLMKLVSLHDCAARGSMIEVVGESPSAGLIAEASVRRFIAEDPRASGFRDRVHSLAKHPIITNWSASYALHEQKTEQRDFGPLLSSLAARGMMPVAITEGIANVQREKIERLGLSDGFANRMLITEPAAEVIDLAKLDSAIADRMAAHLTSRDAEHDGELSHLWHYRCLIDEWSRKTPSFYARCLHAIQQDPDAPEAALRRSGSAHDDTLCSASNDTWRQHPLRFVMIGDRYDKDVSPVIDLLGAKACLTIRLRQGKYAHRHPEESLTTSKRPGHTFRDWESLTPFLTNDLAPDHVTPIAVSPALLPRTGLTDELIDWGHASPLAAVRLMAEIATGVMKSR